MIDRRIGFTGRTVRMVVASLGALLAITVGVHGGASAGEAPPPNSAAAICTQEGGGVRVSITSNDQGSPFDVRILAAVGSAVVAERTDLELGVYDIPVPNGSYNVVVEGDSGGTALFTSVTVDCAAAPTTTTTTLAPTTTAAAVPPASTTTVPAAGIPATGGSSDGIALVAAVSVAAGLVLLLARRRSMPA